MGEFRDYCARKPNKVLNVVKSVVPRVGHSPPPNRLTYYKDIFGSKNSEEDAEGGAISCESESSDDDESVRVRTNAKKDRPAAKVIVIKSEDSEEEAIRTETKAKEARSAFKLRAAQHLNEDSDDMASHDEFVNELQEAAGAKPEGPMTPTSLIETTQNPEEAVASRSPSVRGDPKDTVETARDPLKTAQDPLETTPSQSPPVQDMPQSTLTKHRKFGIFKTGHLSANKHVRDAESPSPTPHATAGRGRPCKRGRKVVEEVDELEGKLSRSKYKTGHLSAANRVREAESPSPTSHTATRPSKRRRKLDEEVDELDGKPPHSKYNLRSRAARVSMVQEPKKAPNKAGSKKYNLRSRKEPTQRQVAFDLDTSFGELEEKLTSTFSRENGGATRRVVSMVLID